MIIDFRKIEVTDLDGNKSTIDVSKSFANAIYQNTGDVGEFELSREIYRNGEVELTAEQANSLKKYTQLFTRVVDRLAVKEALSTE